MRRLLRTAVREAFATAVAYLSRNLTKQKRHETETSRNRNLTKQKRHETETSRNRNLTKKPGVDARWSKYAGRGWSEVVGTHDLLVLPRNLTPFPILVEALE
jgi:hypothetical protein